MSKSDEELASLRFEDSMQLAAKRSQDFDSQEPASLLSATRQLIEGDLIRSDRQAILDALVRICTRLVSADSCALLIQPPGKPGTLRVEASLCRKLGHNHNRGAEISHCAPQVPPLEIALLQHNCARSFDGHDLAHLLSSCAPHITNHLHAQTLNSILSLSIGQKQGSIHKGILVCENSVSVHSYSPYFTREDIDNITEFGGHLETALDRWSDFSAFESATRSTRFTSNAAAILLSYLKHARSLTEADRGIAYLIDQPTSTLRGVALLGCEQFGLAPEDFAYHTSDRAFSTHVIERKSSYFTKNAERDPNAHNWGIHRFSIHGSLLAIPLFYNELAVAVIVLWSSNKTGPSESDEERLRPLTDMAAHCIHLLQEQRLALISQYSLVQQLEAGYIRKDLHGRFTYCNPFFLRLLGHELPEVLGKTDDDFYETKLASKYKADDKDVLDSGQSISDIEPNIDFHGQTVYVHVLKQPLKNSQGVPVGVQCVFLNVPPYIQLRLSQQEQLSGVASWEWHEDDKVLLTSAHFWDIIRKPRQKDIHPNILFRNIAHNSYNSQIESFFNGLRIDIVSETTFSSVVENGTYRWYLLKAFLQTNPKKMTWIHGIIEDVTERRFDTFRRIKTESLELIGKMARSVAHDTLTRFQTVVLALDRTKKFVNNPSLEKTLARALKAHQSASSLLEKLKHLGSQTNKAQPAYVPVAKLIAGVIDISAEYLIKYKVRLHNECSNSLSKVFVNVALMEEAFLNIIVNACEAMTDGGDIHIWTKDGIRHNEPIVENKVQGDEHNKAMIYLGNTGPRIPNEHQKSIWNPDFTTKPHGSGLGLYATKNIVEVHGGKVYFTQEECDRCSCVFVIELPVI